MQGLHLCICTYNTLAQGTILHYCTSPRSSMTLYSVFVFCSGSVEVTRLDLSGSNAATSSIFLNCHGNRDGYRNGRMSKPAKKESKSSSNQTPTMRSAKTIAYGCHLGYTPPTFNTKPSEKRKVKKKKKRVTTYSMVRRCERRHLVSVARVFKIEQLDLLSDLPRRQPRTPFVHQLSEDAVRPTLLHLA